MAGSLILFQLRKAARKWDQLGKVCPIGLFLILIRIFHCCKRFSVATKFVVNTWLKLISIDNRSQVVVLVDESWKFGILLDFFSKVSSRNWNTIQITVQLKVKHFYERINLIFCFFCPSFQEPLRSLRWVFRSHAPLQTVVFLTWGVLIESV